ncbi:MAG: tetratricopeptide repeat protein [Methanotrichaceae archaeon]
MDRLLEGYSDKLNEYERFVLLASAYLHDIGMQSPEHAGLEKKMTYTVSEEEQIRENHNEASAKMIVESCSSGASISLGLEHSIEFADCISQMARYHRSLDLKELTDSSLAGEDIKLPLLAALLRLGDELDADFRRVNIEILKIRDIPLVSKYHWWAHYYVQSVEIKRGIVTLYFRFPEDYRGEQIIGALQGKIIESVRSQYLQIYDLLYDSGINLYRDIKHIEKFQPSGLEPIPSDLLEYIQLNIIKSREHSDELSIKTGVVWYLDGVPFSDNERVVTCLRKITDYANQEKYSEAIKEVEKCRSLIMGPKELLTFSLIAGNCNHIMGDLSRAKSFYEEAIRISERKDLQALYKNDIIQSKSGALGNIGLIYTVTGDLDKALKYHQEALEIDKEIGFRQGKASNLGNIGLIYTAKGDLDKALKYHHDALKIDKEIGFRSGEAIQLGNIGLIYGYKGDLDKALKHHQNALKIDKEIGYRRDEATQLGNIGLIYGYKGDLDKALKYFQDALDIDKEIGYRQGEADQLGNIGLIYGYKGDLDKALKYHQDSLKIDKEIGYRQGEANDLGNIGLIYSDKGDIDQALKYQQDALKIDKEIGYRQGEANTLGNIGLIFRAKGDLDQALKYHQEALKIHKKVGYRQGEATDLVNIGLIYSDKGDPGKALKYNQDARKIRKEIGLI